MLLNVLYWVLLILCFIGGVVVFTGHANYYYINGGATLLLFIIIGLRAFRIELK